MNYPLTSAPTYSSYTQTMMISLRRKHIGVVLGLLLLAGLGWAVWPFIASPSQMDRFCNSLAVGTSIEQVQAQAAQHGYRVSSLIEGRAFVHDSRSFGRFTCNLQFGSNGLMSSVYSFND
ncbi:MAG: hypothetical protein NUV51_08725 [Sulfuricaulis sp.]|nr:hypothetical protein [Sulfuricaulis sp.]